MKRVIRIERFPNPDCRDFHINRIVSHSRIERFERPLRDTSEEYLKKVGSPGSAMVKSIMRLPGVDTVHISPYNVGVVISPVHGWDSLEPSILRILCNGVFGTDPKNVQIERM